MQQAVPITAAVVTGPRIVEIWCGLVVSLASLTAGAVSAGRDASMVSSAAQEGSYLNVFGPPVSGIGANCV